MALSFALPARSASMPAHVAGSAQIGSLRGTSLSVEESSGVPSDVAVARVAMLGLVALTGKKKQISNSRIVKCAVQDGWSHCADYKPELLETVKALTMPGKGILAMDESNGTCGLRLQSIGVENTVENRQRWRQCLLGTKGLGEYCGGAILFTETLYQSTTDGKLMVDLAKENGIIPGIKVDTGLVPLVGGNEGENWCRGLDDLKDRTVDYYKAGARFAKWRTTVRVREHSALAVSEAAHGLARYASICQSSGLVPIIEPEILLDGEHDIDECLATFEETWAAVFKACADFGVMLEAVLLKPSMVTPGAQSGKTVDPQTIVEYTLGGLKRVVPPAVPGIMFLSGGQSEIDATLNLNASNQAPNPLHVSFSYARALQNTTLKTWARKDANVLAALAKLIQQAGANSKAQLGKYDLAAADEEASAAGGMYVKDSVYVAQKRSDKLRLSADTHLIGRHQITTDTSGVKLDARDYAILHKKRLDRQLRCQSRRFLPFKDCCAWVQNQGMWSSQEEWEEWVELGEELSPYIPTRPDEYYSSLGQWKGWYFFLHGVQGDDDPSL